VNGLCLPFRRSGGAQLLDAAARHGLAVRRHPPGAISVSNGDGRPLVWVSDLAGLLDGSVAPEDHDALAGPWEQVVFVDPGDTPARRALAAELVNALTGGTAGDGAELVAGEEGLTLVPGSDLEDEAVPLAGPTYLCVSGGDGAVLALGPEEYEASLRGDW
jgi:hypothetical protein